LGYESIRQTSLSDARGTLSQQIDEGKFATSVGAANNPLPEEAKTCEIEDAREFLVESIGASVTTTVESGHVAIDRRESDGVICLSGRLSDSHIESFEEEGMGGGGFGGMGVEAVHSAAFPK
jgi:hypothetical protein